MAKYDPDLVELVKLSRPTRIRVDGSKVVKTYAAGAIVKVSGNDKSQCIATGGTVVKNGKESAPIDIEAPPDPPVGDPAK